MSGKTYIVLFLTLALAGISDAKSSMNLLEDPTVQAAGTYVYFARGDADSVAVSPFTKAFFPGGTDVGRGLHANDPKGPAGRDGKRADTGENTGPISMGRGELTVGFINFL